MKQELIRAINSYTFPSEEQLYIMDYYPEDFLSANPEQYLYVCRSWRKDYKNLASFCAAALFNYLEDGGAGGLNAWPRKAMESLCTLVDVSEFTKKASEFINRLKKRSDLEFKNISDTVLLYNERNFWAAAGISNDQFIAIFWETSSH